MAHEIRTVAHSGHVADNPNTYSYSGSFDVFKGIEVKVTLDNVVLTHTTSTINESASPREYTVDTTAKTIHIGGADLSSGEIKIIPRTDLGQLVNAAPKAKADYTPGSSITSEDLNNNQLQLMRRALEYDEQKLDTSGGTMTGNLHFGKDIDLSFEGSTDNAYETTLTVTDPTADRTITLPNVSGTVVTTGDTATVTATMLAANSVDSSELVDGSIDTSHFSTGAVDSAAIANGTITNDDISTSAGIQFTKFEDLDSAKILVGNGSNKATEVAVSGDVTIANTGAVTIATGAVEHAMLAADAVDGDNIADDSVNSEHYVDASIDHAHLSNDCIDGDNIQDDAIGAEHIASNAVVSDSIADGSIVNADLNASAAIAHSKLAAVPDSQVLVGNGSTVPTAVAISGDVTLANDGAVTIANDAVEIGMIGCEQTTISDSDSHIPTSGAVVDYVAAQLLPFGGFEAIADEDNFPTVQPAAGVVISIKDATGVTVDGSGESSTCRTAGNGSDNVTITGFPSSMNSAAVPTSTGLLVTSTGSSHTYTFHRLLPTTDDVRQLSDDVNDFFERYRIAGSAPGSDNHAGDLYYDTGTDKMYVRNADNDAWGEVTSTGEFKYLVLSAFNTGTGNAAVLNGSIAKYDLRENSTSGSLASVTNAAQLIVSLNGVVQKANTGTSAPAEGFAMVDAHTIIFGSNLESGDSVFIVQIGSAVSIPTPGDNTVTSAKIVDGAIVNADINASADIAGSKLADDSIAEAKLAIHAAPTGTDKFLGYTSNGMEWATVPPGTPTTTRGDIIYRGASADERLAKGTAGQFLKIGANDPEWSDVSAGAVGGSTDKIFWEHGTTVTTNYTIGTEFGAACNAISEGPITINNGITVTVDAGDTWTIV